MYFSTAVISVLVIPAFVAAQYGYAPPSNGGGAGSGSSSSSAAAAAPSAPPSGNGFINVDVAPGGNLVYSPSNFTAPNGTIVTFYFPNAGLSHTATQSSFNDPCTPLAANSSTGAPAGFDSSFQAGVQFSINITNDQIPIWFHCKLPMHCGLGMVGAINAPSTGNTFDAFMAKAKAIGSSEPVESTGPVVLGGVGASAAVSPSNTATVSSSSSSGSSSGTIRIVGTTGATALLGVAAAMILFAGSIYAWDPLINFSPSNAE